MRGVTDSSRRSARHFAKLDAAGGEVRGGVDVVGELVFEGDDFVAGAPVDAAHQQAEAGGGVGDEGDVVGACSG